MYHKHREQCHLLFIVCWVERDHVEERKAVLLTLTLAAFMVAVFSSRSGEPAVGGEQEIGVSEEDYRLELKELMSAFRESYASAQDDLARLVLVEQTMNRLLTLRVPSNQKDLHLELAFALNRLREGLRGDAELREDGQERLERVLTEYPWLK